MMACGRSTQSFQWFRPRATDGVAKCKCRKEMAHGPWTPDPHHEPILISIFTLDIMVPSFQGNRGVTTRSPQKSRFSRMPLPSHAQTSPSKCKRQTLPLAYSNASAGPLGQEPIRSPLRSASPASTSAPSYPAKSQAVPASQSYAGRMALPRSCEDMVLQAATAFARCVCF